MYMYMYMYTCISKVNFDLTKTPLRTMHGNDSGAILLNILRPFRWSKLRSHISNGSGATIPRCIKYSAYHRNVHFSAHGML